MHLLVGYEELFRITPELISMSPNLHGCKEEHVQEFQFSKDHYFSFQVELCISFSLEIILKYSNQSTLSHVCITTFSDI